MIWLRLAWSPARTTKTPSPPDPWNGLITASPPWLSINWRTSSACRVTSVLGRTDSGKRWKYTLLTAFASPSGSFRTITPRRAAICPNTIPADWAHGRALASSAGSLRRRRASSSSTGSSSSTPSSTTPARKVFSVLYVPPGDRTRTFSDSSALNTKSSTERYRTSCPALCAASPSRVVVKTSRSVSNELMRKAMRMGERGWGSGIGGWGDSQSQTPNP